MPILLSSLLLGGLVWLSAGKASAPAPPPVEAGSLATTAANAVATTPETQTTETPAPTKVDGPEPVDDGSEAPEVAMRDTAVRVLTEVGMVYVPRTFHPNASGGFDLVIHFHGAPPAVEAALDHAHIDAVLVIVNLGLGSGPYETRYQHEAALEAVVKVAERTLVKKHVMDAPHVGRIALSSWSAGYGAVWRLLMRDKVSERVDAVLLADGLHGAFKPGGRHVVEEAHMAPFVRFATMAASGDRLMAITHSGIETYTYASTTETAAYLERTVAATVTPMADEGARAA